MVLDDGTETEKVLMDVEAREGESLSFSSDRNVISTPRCEGGQKFTTDGLSLTIKYNYPERLMDN